MKPVYIPMLKAKHGETSAIVNLTPSEKNRIIPFFDLPKPSLNDMEKHGIKSVIDKCVDDICYAFSTHDKNLSLFVNEGEIFLDSFYFDRNETIGGLHILNYAANRLRQANIIVNPVIGYERWGEQEYHDAIMDFEFKEKNFYCLRLGEEALDVDIPNEPDYFEDNLKSILSSLSLSPNKLIVILDFSNISEKSISDIIDIANKSIDLLSRLGFENIYTSGSSMPDSLGKVVASNSEATLRRKEMSVWKKIYENNKTLDIGFADYGIRNPQMADNSGGAVANAKIWYTIGSAYFVVRGHLMSEPPKGDQFKKLAAKVISSGYFSHYSDNWGDFMIKKSAVKSIKNLTDWISIGTNHHIHTLLNEILEFKYQVHSTRPATQVSEEKTKEIHQS